MHTEQIKNNLQNQFNVKIVLKFKTFSLSFEGIYLKFEPKYLEFSIVFLFYIRLIK